MMKYIEIRFCPLKGLIIMNFNDLFQFVKWEDEEPFPSPTGVNYYELLNVKEVTAFEILE